MKISREEATSALAAFHVGLLHPGRIGIWRYVDTLIDYTQLHLYRYVLKCDMTFRSEQVSWSHYLSMTTIRRKFPVWIWEPPSDEWYQKNQEFPKRGQPREMCPNVRQRFRSLIYIFCSRNIRHDLFNGLHFGNSTTLKYSRDPPRLCSCHMPLRHFVATYMPS